MTPWTVACQAPLSMGFSSQEYWSGLSFPSPGHLPNPGIKPTSPVSPALQADSLPPETWGKPIHVQHTQSHQHASWEGCTYGSCAVSSGWLTIFNRSLQYSCLENSRDRGAWQAIVHGIKRAVHSLATKPPPPPPPPSSIDYFLTIRFLIKFELQIIS